MEIHFNLFSILILAISFIENFVNVYGEGDSFAEEMKEYNDGTVTRNFAVTGKPNEYKILKFLATGSGTAVYKTDYNGVMAAIKVLKYSERQVYSFLKKFLINERMILDKLKDESKSAEELGYIKLYDYIEDGHLVGKTEREEKTPHQSHQKSSDSKKVGQSFTAIIEDIKDMELKPAEIKVMAIVVTYFDTDLQAYFFKNKNPKDFNSMRSLIKKVLTALWHLHQKGIIHNDVAIQNIGLIGDNVVLFDFGTSVVYNASAEVKDMIYVQVGLPVGMKTVLSWDAVMKTETYIRRFADDIISAILAMWSVHGALPWREILWRPTAIDKARDKTFTERNKYHKENYTNMATYYKNLGKNISPQTDELLQTLYKKVISNPTNIDYQDLINECSKPLQSVN